jgi:hypothetical protein
VELSAHFRYDSDMTKTERDSTPLEGLFTETGEVAQPLIPIALRVPISVSLAGRDGEEADELWWTLPAHEGVPGGARQQRSKRRAARVPTERLLDKFCELAGAPVERIERFAEQWGPLELCRHGLPHTHRSARSAWPPIASGRFRLGEVGCVPDGFAVKESDGSESGREPIERWRWFSRQVGSLRRISSKLHQGENARREDWIEILASLTPQPELAFKDIKGSRVSQWRVVVRLLELWLEWGDVRPRITMASHVAGAERPIKGITLAGETLFAAIAIYLLAAITKGSFATCSECGDSFVPKRRPTAGNASYCPRPGCGRDAAVRKAQERLRERRKLAKDLKTRGMTESAIAAKLGSKIETVRGWLRGTKVRE